MIEVIKLEYEKLYKELFNAITDAINELQKSKVIDTAIEESIQILKKAQCKTEEMYINKQ